MRDSLVSEVTATRELGQVLSEVARGAARLCHAQLAAITVLTESRDQLALIDVFGTAGVIVEKVLPIAGSLNGTVLTSGRSFRSRDVLRDRRPIVRDIARRNRVRGVLIVPLQAREGLLGTLAVASRRDWDFTARDQARLEDFVNVASIAIDNACLREQLRRVGFAASAAGLQEDSIPSREGRRVEGRDREPPGVVSGNQRLTPRERDIAALLLSDRTCKEVAAALQLSSHTVRHYVERLKLRFGQKTLHGLVRSLDAWGKSAPAPLPIASEVPSNGEVPDAPLRGAGGQ
jgi:GAF domain-containing protein